MKLKSLIAELVAAFRPPKAPRRNYVIRGNRCPKCGTVGSLVRWWLPVVEGYPRKLGGYN